MHELALMESVVDHVIERIEGRVTTVKLEIGELAGVDVDALRFCFGVCTEHTPLAGAELSIVRVPARAHCLLCGADEPTRSFASPCTCGSYERTLVTGDELRLKEVEVCDV